MSNNTDFNQPYAGRLTELHLHLDGSLRPASVVELAKQQNIQLPTEDLEGADQRIFAGIGGLYRSGSMSETF